jgi:translocator protein
VLGSLATFPNLHPWYANLAKPVFTPPNWVFGPAWTALYTLMAFAIWRVIQVQPGAKLRMPAISFFFIQLILNAAWSWMFFAAQSPAFGLLNIVPQWITVLGTCYLFCRLDRLAGWAIFPLVVWVSFAVILNLTIWRLN